MSSCHSATPAGSKLTLWAEFEDPKLERHYKHSILHRSTQQVYHALLLATALFLLFGFTDYRTLDYSNTLLWLLAIRIVVVISCIALVLQLRRKPHTIKHHQITNLACLIAINGLLLIISLRPDDFGTYLASAVTMSMALYLLVPSRLPWALFWNTYLMVGFSATMLLRTPISVEALTVNLLLLGLVNLVGSMAMLRLNCLQRRQFFSLLEERKTNRRLQREIHKRRKLETQLRHSASTDHLTGLNNRRKFFELAKRELRLAHRSGTPLALLMIDIDHFKQFNDNHGHRIGDQVLITVALHCQMALRDTDIIGRYGGEEFIVALPNTSLNTATEIAERLRQQVNELQLQVGSVTQSLSVTVGVSLTYDENSLEPALQRADRALYDGKAQGRNCVVIAPVKPVGLAEA